MRRNDLHHAQIAPPRLGTSPGLCPKALAPADRVSAQLLGLHYALESALGDLRWWPAETDSEMIIGAILVQNVAWSNVVTAITALRSHHLLDFKALRCADPELIAACIRSTRFYKSKRDRLLHFAHHIQSRHDGQLARLLAQPLPTLRAELLSIKGIGPETADDILLYAARLPSFVVDAYTKRIMSRCGYCDEDIAYETLRSWFMQHLPSDTALYNQFHAWLDAVGHQFCKSRRPLCGTCPVATYCDTANVTGGGVCP